MVGASVVGHFDMLRVDSVAVIRIWAAPGAVVDGDGDACDDI